MPKSNFPSPANSRASIQSARAKSEGFGKRSIDQGLPDYRVRESSRAKHVSIKVSLEGEVEVVVPLKFDRARLPDLLAKRQGWIEKTRSRLLKDRTQTVEDWHVERPETIVFRWRSQLRGDLDLPPSPAQQDLAPDLDIWSVVYQPDKGNEILCVPTLDNRLTIKGNTGHLPSCQAVLRKWLAHMAHRELAPWLRQLGFELGLPCREISVRGQKTRWASCSSRKDISLNYKLLFLPRPLVHYVLVHELCHTVHMNHSADFWALVADKQPDYRQWRAELKQGWRYVPRWVET